MKILQLVKSEVRSILKPLLLVLGVAGISSVILINSIHLAAFAVTQGASEQKYFLLLLFCIFLFLITEKYILDILWEVIETFVAKIRNRIALKLYKAEFSTLENIGTASIYTRLTQDITDISNLSSAIINSIKSIVVVSFMLIYVLYFSFESFVVMFIGILLGIIAYGAYNRTYIKNWHNLSLKETAFFEKFNHILHGFKEIRVNDKKNNSIFDEFVQANDAKTTTRIDALKLYNRNAAISHTFFYISLLFIVFVLPHFYEEYAAQIIHIVAIMLFIIGDLDPLLNAIICLSIVENAASNIINLENQLDQEIAKQEYMSSELIEQTTLSFQRNIHLRGLVYQYDTGNSSNPFTIGPINLTIQKGELIFITGGNGSGKSTFLKMLVGLYLPKRGQIYVDYDKGRTITGTLIGSDNYQAYRELFTLLFTDFHLFNKLYGLERVDEQIVNDLLINLGLSSEKTSYQNGSFTNLKLSSGQKKRLALANCILEDKEIYIFDEVAADLDPAFRDVYYHEILQELQSRNKTIFVVSHDKDYWHVADRILELKNGQLFERSADAHQSILN